MGGSTMQLQQQSQQYGASAALLPLPSYVQQLSINSLLHRQPVDQHGRHISLGCAGRCKGTT